jgi:hypothetical protein
VIIIVNDTIKKNLKPTRSNCQSLSIFNNMEKYKILIIIVLLFIEQLTKKNEIAIFKNSFVYL